MTYEWRPGTSDFYFVWRHFVIQDLVINSIISIVKYIKIKICATTRTKATNLEMETFMTVFVFVWNTHDDVQLSVWIMEEEKEWNFGSNNKMFEYKFLWRFLFHLDWNEDED